jgi:predicted dehydrogenase
MAGSELRIGIVGCGHAARIHLDRLVALAKVRVVGCADADRAAAEGLCARVAGGAAAAFDDHRELLRQAAPQALAIFTPHLAHYRPAMDALQAGCHVFIEKPLSTNVQEAVDIVSLARARGLKVGVGHQYRLRPSLVEARTRLASGAIGPLRLVTATMTQPWLKSHGGAENSWRFDPRVTGGGMLSDAGDHLLDALLWTTGQTATEASAVQARLDPGLDVVTAAAVRLSKGTPAIFALSGVTPGSLFELSYFGEEGRLRVTEHDLVEERDGKRGEAVVPGEPSESIDANFAAAVTAGASLCCPADEALDTVRLLEAVTRSATTGQVVRLVRTDRMGRDGCR